MGQRKRKAAPEQPKPPAEQPDAGQQGATPEQPAAQNDAEQEQTQSQNQESEEQEQEQESAATVALLSEIRIKRGVFRAGVELPESHFSDKELASLRAQGAVE